jgi:MoaA/NifB/PqqE/SkfB family radical SAM enzyme
LNIYFVKNPNAIVLPEPNESCCIINRSSGEAIHLSKSQASHWYDWNSDDISGLDDIISDLVAFNLIQEKSLSAQHRIESTQFDSLKPVMQYKYVRSYSETPDLTILFNTQPLIQNNPLLILGPYGSLIWRGVCDRKTIKELRVNAASIFGIDEVLPFLQRLMNLGFLMPERDLIDSRFSTEQMIKEFPAPEIQFMLKHAKVPWYCLWEICTNCDSHCEICYNPDHGSKGPTKDGAMRIATQIIEAGIFYVSLLGGEALLREDLEEIVKTLRSAGVFVKLITNGLQLSLARSESLAAAGLNQIEVSFDGLTPRYHDISRGSGAFLKAEKALIQAQRSGIPRVGIVFTLNSQNINEFHQLPSFMHEHSIRECYISLFKKVGLLGSNAPWDAIADEAIDSLHSQIQRWSTTYPELIITLLPVCTCGRTSVVIGADQRMRPCPFVHTKAGESLEQESLLNLWASIGEALYSDDNSTSHLCLVS